MEIIIRRRQRLDGDEELRINTKDRSHDDTSAEFSEGHLHQLEAKFHFLIHQDDQSTFKTIYPLDHVDA